MSTGYCRSLILSFFWQILGTNNPVHGIMNTFPSLKFLASVEDAKIEEKIEARRIKLSRYRKKRISRNYGRNIKVKFLSPSDRMTSSQYLNKKKSQPYKDLSIYS